MSLATSNRVLLANIPYGQAGGGKSGRVPILFQAIRDLRMTVAVRVFHDLDDGQFRLLEILRNLRKYEGHRDLAGKNVGFGYLAAFSYGSVPGKSRPSEGGVYENFERIRRLRISDNRPNKATYCFGLYRSEIPNRTDDIYALSPARGEGLPATTSPCSETNKIDGATGRRAFRYHKRHIWVGFPLPNHSTF